VLLRLPGSSGHRRHRRHGPLWGLASQHQVGVALPRPDQWSILAFDPGGINLVAFYGDGPAWCGTWTLKAESSEPARSQAAR
jgi:hypothetical protein